MNGGNKFRWTLWWMFAVFAVITSLFAQSPSPEKKSSYMPVVDKETFDVIHQPHERSEADIMKDRRTCSPNATT